MQIFSGFFFGHVIDTYWTFPQSLNWYTVFSVICPVYLASRCQNGKYRLWTQMLQIWPGFCLRDLICLLDMKDGNLVLTIINGLKNIKGFCDNKLWRQTSYVEDSEKVLLKRQFSEFCLSERWCNIVQAVLKLTMTLNSWSSCPCFSSLVATGML